MTLLLAEIGDKMPTVGGTALVACIIALIAFGLAFIQRWLVLFVVPIALLYDWVMWSELHEPGFGQLIISELGWGWVVGQFVGWNVPFVGAVTAALLIARRVPRGRHGARRRRATFCFAAGGTVLCIGGIVLWIHGTRTVGRLELQLPSHESKVAISAAALALFHGDGGVRFSYQWFRRELGDPTDARYYRQHLSLGYRSWETEHLAPDKLPSAFIEAWNHWRLFGLGLYDATRQDVFFRVIEIPLWLAVSSGAVMVVLGIRTHVRSRQHDTRGLCQRCSYNLKGNVSGRCPECGAAFTRGAEHEYDGTLAS